VAPSGVTINNLLPGLHATDRMVVLDQLVADAENTDPETIKSKRCEEIPVGRYGTTDEFGAACAWLCSQRAGFIVGQNILLDGGTFWLCSQRAGFIVGQNILLDGGTFNSTM
jgi:3-oxoacyl-[acyl-carrier protein] reductase